MLGLFIPAILLAATLLFLIQPMIGKLILPLMGGSPSVWNTVMLFFQGMLLAGYAYAHLLSHIRRATRQLIIHALVLVAAAALLPIALPGGAAAMVDPSGFAPGQVLWLLTAACAGPVFVLASASPLLQQWFARTRHRTAGDPYYLYVASNAGSMAALLGYPVLVEPYLTLSQQRIAWSIAFGAFALLALACGITAARSSTDSDAEGESSTPRVGASEPSSKSPQARLLQKPASTVTKQRLLWMALSFVPAGLMMGATQHITTDIAAVPLLWVLPLAIYLLTYIIAFARIGPAFGRVAGLLLPPVVVAVAVLAIVGLRTPAWIPIASHLLLLFTASAACHGRLAESRPPADRLTEFYLLIAVGGVMAGIVCGITAPSVFNGIVEYPLFIVGACLLRPARGRRPQPAPRINFARPAHWLRLTLGAIGWILVLSIVPFYVFMMAWLLGPEAPDESLRRPLFQVCWIIPAAATVMVLSRRWMYAAAVLMLLAVPWFDRQLREQELVQIRTFFGVHRVVRLHGIAGDYHLLFHGRTEHGRQWRGEPLAREPMAYFTRSGPVGDVFRELDARLPHAHDEVGAATESWASPQRIAVIGLGAGTLAAYGRQGRDFTFYEIDPVVRDIATDPDLFTYIRDSASSIHFVLGDARLTIAQAPESAYDLIAMDAFSSDAVPVHLITREAVRAYLRALRPAGLLMFNVSNLYIDFEPVLSRLADDAGLVGVIRKDRRVSLEEMQSGKQPSAFVVLARRREDLGSLASHPLWRPLTPAPRMRVWTDDYSDLLRVVMWR